MEAAAADLRKLRHREAQRIVRDCARDLGRMRGFKPGRVASIRGIYHKECAALPPQTAPLARLYCSILCDLRGQGWAIAVEGSDVTLNPPEPRGESPEVRKAQVRTGHLLERDAQLMLPQTRRFVCEMERRRNGHQGWHSVFSLMRDGRELAEKLRGASALPPGEARRKALRDAVDPYVEIVESDKLCSFTGLRLVDVWRYFRYTWSTPYFSTPGRRMLFLIRDRAAKNHPVVGIGALGSAIVQLGPRDAWIGWTSEQVWSELAERPTAKWARWLAGSLETLVKGLYVTDLIGRRLISHRAIQHPTESDVTRLRKYATAERRLHHLYPKRGFHKMADSAGTKTDSLARAQTHLFRSKRAEMLASLLEARRRLRAAGFCRPTLSDLNRLERDGATKQAVATVLRHVKATHAGVNMMDITVCGAIAPYNGLLAGKLVSLLMASPEVRESYSKRYDSAVSVIASGMAGRPVHRRPTLVLLGTTSLYDVAPAQYNRLRVPAERAGGRKGEQLAFLLIGRTAGFGSFHFSRPTMELIELVLARRRSGRPVNSIFGEGVNPKLRKVRSALELLGLPADVVLQHRSPRLVFAIPLATNYREVLLGLAKRAKFIIPASVGSTSAIVEFWRERWLSARVDREGVLAGVELHTSAYPVHHGARVGRPSRTGAAAIESPQTPQLLEGESDEEAELVAAGIGKSDE